MITESDYKTIIQDKLHIVYNEHGLKLALASSFCCHDVFSEDFGDDAGEALVAVEKCLRVNYPKKFPCYILPDVTKYQVTGRRRWGIVYPETFRELDSTF